MRRLIIPVLLLAGVAAGHGHPTPAPVRLVFVYDEHIASQHPVVRAHFDERTESLNGWYGSLGIRFSVEDVRPFGAAVTSACTSADPLILALSADSEPGTIVVGVTGARRAAGDPLGCAYQDGWLTGDRIVALHDPPYATLLLAGSKPQSDHHSVALYAHEIGHVLGGSHALAWGASTAASSGGTIMHPIIQYNVPEFSGRVHGGMCVVGGNACKVYAVTRGLSFSTPGEDAGRLVFDPALEEWPS